MHGLKSIMPLLQWPGAAEGRGDVQLAPSHHGDDSFPDRPVVTEASLQSDIFLNKGIEAEVERLWSPSHLADPPGRTHDLDSDLESGRRSRGINHAITAQTIPFPGPVLHSLGEGDTAIFLCDPEARGVRG